MNDVENDLTGNLIATSYSLVEEVARLFGALFASNDLKARITSSGILSCGF